MSDVFMFSAQPEQGRSEEVKEKPPDPNFSVKRSRTFKRSRTLEEYNAGNLRKSGNNENAAKPPDVSAKDDPYGPWLQVSYGRNMRSNNGPKFAGKRSGNGGSFGKMESGNRVESGPSTQGVEISGQATEIRKDAGKNSNDRSSRNGLPSTKDMKIGAKKVGGSRFEILTEGLDMEFEVDLVQSQSGDQGKPVPRKGLVEISNIQSFNRKQLTPPANKYLVDNMGDNSSFNKSLKENVRKGNVKVNKKEKLQVSYLKSGAQSKDMEEDLQDYEVLKIFHKEVSQSISPVYQPSSSSGTKVNSITEEIVNPNLDNSLQQVDISNAGSFDVVASKLKEAMEVAME
ncbi:hypothetical protein Q3G72_004474 [Acer saccharum]|nr:hypothetical protein Q3G72_004474 [Acer saccharum]